MNKIIFGITGLTLGGAERVLVDIANALVDKYDITIFTLYSKGELEKAIAEAKTHLNDESGDSLKAAIETLQNVVHKAAGEMYAQQGGQPGAQPEAGEGQANKKDDDDVVDADFKEV